MRPAAFLLALMIAGTAQAQPREQTVSNLAFVLGQSHALRQLCLGPDDQYWRQRMLKMIELEAPHPAARKPLAEHFNDGFTAGKGQYPRCSAQSRAAERSTAARGQALARLLAQPMASR
jgi:uncharacterized protein (TIGR02301 family)